MVLETKRGWGRLAFAPLLAVLSAQAPPPTADEHGEVVVLGERLTQAQFRERAASYIRHTGIASGEQPTARWLVRVCPKVVGIPPAAALQVEERIRTIALEASAPLGRAGCNTNALIAFVGDGPATMRDIANKRSTSLQEVPLHARSTLLNGDAPVRWWYTTRAQGKDGDQPDGGQPPAVTGVAASVGPGTATSSAPSQTLPGNMDTQFQAVHSSSHISTQSVRGLHSANVVIDVKRLNGVGLDAVTDFAAFVILAEIQPRNAPQPDSVLGLFSGTSPDRRLTEWDTAVLRALYRMPLDRISRLQRGALMAAVLDTDRRKATPDP